MSCIDKNLLLLVIVFGFVVNVYAQQDSLIINEQELSEVIIESKRIVHHDNYDSYQPSTLQKEHAANALDLLYLIRLPRIRVNQVEMSVSNIVGEMVQIRINNIPSTVADLQAITPDRVLVVDHIVNPGQKYGKDVASVINVKIKNDDTGIACGVNTMNAVTTNYNDDNVWVKYTKNKSEFGVLYNLKLNSNEDVKTNSHQKFLMADNTIKNVLREGNYNDSRFVSQDVTLSYNVTNGKSRVFDTKLSMNWNSFPDRYLSESVSDGNSIYEMITYNKSIEKRPMLKLYYEDDITNNNTLSVYLTTAYVRNNYTRGITSPTMYNAYDVIGDKYSILGEVNFTHSFEKVGELNLGYRQTGEFTKNSYQTEESQIASLHNDSEYLYSEYSAELQKFGVTAGIGICRDGFMGSDGKYEFFSLRPILNVIYKVREDISLRYNFERKTMTPLLSQLTSFLKYDNNYEEVVGNPYLKPYNTNCNEIVLDCDFGNTYISLATDYNYSPHMICDAPVERTENRMFKYSYWNNANKHHFNISLYGEQYLFGQHLFIYAMPYMVRDIITGEVRHDNTCWSVKIGGSIYIDMFNIDFDYDSPSENLDGETLARDFGSTTLSLGYKRKALSVKCSIKNMFNNKGSRNTMEYLSDIAYSHQEIRNQGFGNMVYLSLSWNISSGKKNTHNAIKTTSANIDTGIIK